MLSKRTMCITIKNAGIKSRTSDLCQEKGLGKSMQNLHVGLNVTERDDGAFSYVYYPNIHTPSESAMEAFCIRKNYKNDNVMR